MLNSPQLVAIEHATTDEILYLESLISSFKLLNNIQKELLVSIRDINGICIFATNKMAIACGFENSQKMINTSLEQIPDTHIKNLVKHFKDENNEVIQNNLPLKRIHIFKFADDATIRLVKKKPVNSLTDNKRVLGIYTEYQSIYAQDVLIKYLVPALWDDVPNHNNKTNDYKTTYLNIVEPTENIEISELEQQVIFLLANNLDNRKITDFINRITGGNYSIFTIERIINKQLYSKFKVTNRKTLLYKLIESNYNLQIPQSLITPAFVDLL